MKIKVIITTILFLSFTWSTIYSQDFDCLTKLKMRQANAPYKINELSKSAICKTGEKYEYNIELKKDKDYRLSFFASSVFNNKINFKILNKTTGELLINLPGVSIDDVQGCALKEYFDDKSNKLVHPFFNFSPKVYTQLKIIIEVDLEPDKHLLHTNNLLASNDQKKGCVTVFVQTKDLEVEGFE